MALSIKSPGFIKSASSAPAIGLVAALLSTASCSRSQPPPPAPAGPPAVVTTPLAMAQPATAATTQPAGERVIRLMVVTHIHNNIEACGCTSEPLGDVARLAATVAGKDALLLDAGGLRYDVEPLPADKLPQAQKKAEFLESTWRALGAITMLQPEDLRGDPTAKELAGSGRVASNVSGLPPGSVVSESLRTVGGVAIGVLGLADPEAAWPSGVQVSDPIAAAQAGVQRLRGQGAQAIVALTGLKREVARRLLRKVPGLQLVVAGGDRDLAEGVEQPEAIGDSLLVVPGEKGERAMRIELHLPAAGRPAWTLVPSRRQKDAQTAQLKQKLQASQARLATLRADASADPAFVKTTEAEAQRLQAELQTAQAPSPPPPATGYVIAELVPIGRALPRDPKVAADMTALDRRIGEANLAATAGPPKPPPSGQPRYVGDAGCVTACHYHSDAMEFWQKTRHAAAWKTLVDGKKDLSYDCVGCHAAGFEAAGGSNLWTLAQWQRAAPPAARPAPAVGPDLRNVQCEACHGPGSLHARAPSKVPMPIPRPKEDRCLGCHTKEHSDTFAIAPYLRDILGPGHGEDRRRELGPGPTAHELRQAAQNSAAHAAPP